MAANATIKAIEPSTIHQIQSGQIIVDLCSVAKELVENSLDAGATSIDVRFKNQGLDSIEVQDNGYGISPSNYETLALKHYTSKLSTYADLTTLQTFGFRGEALSSLCALSQFSVVTCTQEEAPKAKKLEFETSGKLKNSSVVSGHKGTTVVVENLFYNLPVRRRELERNIKREWGKVISLLNQYACVQTGVKFSVSQQPTKGKRMVLFSTKGNLTTRDNIINVFGVKSMAALIPLDLKLELVPTHNPLHKRKADDDDDGTREIRVKGHVSRPTHGEGRQTPDRQMFYVNGRPCGLPQFAKVFNEVYRSYNSSQSPFIFADIQLDTHLYDVNVSPDKRTILLHDQGQMLDNLRESLIELFEKQDVTVPSSQLLTGKQTPFKRPSVVRRDTPGSERSESTRASPFTQQQQQQPSSAPDDEEEPAAEEEEEDEDDGEPEVMRFSVTSRNAKRVSNTSSAADAGAQSLMSRWVERKTDGQQPTKSRSPATAQKTAQQSIFAAFRRNQAPPKSSLEEEFVSSPAEEEESDASSNHEDEVEEIASGQQVVEGSSDNPAEEVASQQDSDQASEMHESPIPAIAPLSQPRPTLAPSTRSPRRPEQQVAVIRIGDEEVQGVIGAPPKRPRTTDSASTSPAKKRMAKPSVPLPSFGGRLSQLFAAGGASQPASDQSGSSDDGDGNERDMDEDEDDVPMEENQEGNEEGDQDDSLFVSQDDEQAPSEAEEEKEPGTSPFDAAEDVEPEPSEGYHEKGPESVGHEEPEGGQLSEAGSPEPTGGDADGDYIDPDTALAEDHDGPNISQSESATPLELSEDSLKRQQMLLKPSAKRKDSTIHYLQHLRTSSASIRSQLRTWQSSLIPFTALPPGVSSSSSTTAAGLEAESKDAEDKLSLKISKSDFGKMKIVGQFNLGFIIAVREAASSSSQSSSSEDNHDHHDHHQKQQDDDDEVFIIDQHASDEKFNFERLQSTTVVASQRLVSPKPLELTAMEEEIIMSSLPAFATNGFQLHVDDTKPVGERISLLSLPLSRETTFNLSDLEELIFLLGENPSSSSTTVVPRPSKVRKMFAMRACRASIMIGRALSEKQMATVVRHMGEMEKPWNCPHGRPTMRHLYGLGGWEERGWREGEGGGGETDWKGWIG